MLSFTSFSLFLYIIRNVSVKNLKNKKIKKYVQCIILHTIIHYPLNVSREKSRSSHQRCSIKKGVLKRKVFSCEFCKIFKNTFLQNISGRWFLQSTPPHPHIVRLTIWHYLFLEFWLVVDTWFFACWLHQRVVAYFENVHQLNIRRGKKLGFQLPHRQPPTDSYPPGHNLNSYPDPNPLRWVYFRGIFREPFHSGWLLLQIGCDFEISNFIFTETSSTVNVLVLLRDRCNGTLRKMIIIVISSGKLSKMVLANLIVFVVQ